MLGFVLGNDSVKMSFLLQREKDSEMESESRHIFVLFLERCGHVKTAVKQYTRWDVRNALHSEIVMLNTMKTLYFNNISMDIQNYIELYSSEFDMSAFAAGNIENEFKIQNEYSIRNVKPLTRFDKRPFTLCIYKMQLNFCTVIKPPTLSTDIKPLSLCNCIKTLTLYNKNQSSDHKDLMPYLHKITAKALAYIKSTSHNTETDVSCETNKTTEIRTPKYSKRFILPLCFFYIFISDVCLKIIWNIICRNKLKEFLIYSHKFHKRKSKVRDKELLNSVLNLQQFSVQQNIQAYPVDRRSINSILNHEPSGNTSLSCDSMSSELIRLSTFACCPNTGVSLIRLAAAGFYLERRTNEVVCFSCGLRIKDLSYNFNPILVHQQSSPECPFIREITSTLQSATQIDSGEKAFEYKSRSEQSHQPICNDIGSDEVSYNLSITSSETALPVPDQGTSGFQSSTTLGIGQRSFSTSNLPLSPYHKDGDSGYGSTSSVCSNTNTSSLSRKWESSDSGFGSGLAISNPLQQIGVDNANHLQYHNNHHQNYRQENGCGFRRQISVDGVSNITDSAKQLSLIVEEQSNPLPTSRNDTERQNNSVATNNQQSAPDKATLVSNKKYPEYEYFQRRRDSFKNWPSNKSFINVIDLAESGFFFTNSEDCVRCFQCGIGLKNWDIGDMVWVEHARWSSRCQYLIQMKGQGFVDYVLQIVSKLETDNDAQQSITAQLQTSNNTSIDAHGCTSGVNNLLDHKAARYVLEEKIFEDEELIKKSMEYLVKTNGWNSVTNESLVAHILDTIGTDESPSGVGSNPNGNNHKNYLSSKLDDANVNDKQLPQKDVTQSEVVTNSKADEEPEKIQKENEDMRELYTCKICLDEKVGITFVPCGHLVTCRNCSPKIRKCPLCRTFIRGTIKTTI